MRKDSQAYCIPLTIRHGCLQRSSFNFLANSRFKTFTRLFELPILSETNILQETLDRIFDFACLPFDMN